MAKQIFMLLSLLGLGACTISVTSEQIFLPNQLNRRADSQMLSIQHEARLSDQITLRHELISSGSSNIALTLAKTGSNRLIVACMGNAADRLSDGVGYLEGFVAFGDALIFDYPGYGDSSGYPTINEFNAATSAIKEKVIATDYDEVVIWGHSLGGFVCADLAKKMIKQFDGFIFETSAANIVAVSKAWTPWYAKPFIKLKIEDTLKTYDNVIALKNFEGPILVIGASKDRQLPVTLSRNLAKRLENEAHKVTYTELNGAQHMNVSHHPDYTETIRSFIDKLKD